MVNKIRILVASRCDEDRERIIAAISNETDFHIIGVVEDESGAIIKSADLKPNVLILDLQPPAISGPELAPIIHRKSPSTAIVMLCDRDEDDYAGRALKTGISGFLLKEADMDKLIPVLKIVNSGGYYISASITIRVFGAVLFMDQFPGQARDHSKLRFEQKDDYPSFSPAERNIVTYIAQGLSDEEIADHLHFSIGTIRNYLAAIKRKTKLKNRTQIVIFSLVYGIISFDHLDIFKNNADRQIFNDPLQ